MTWFVGMWYFYSFKRTRLEPNYIKKNNNNFVRILMPLSRVWPKGHQNYDLCIWCNIGFVLRSLKKWAVGINSITQRNYLIGNSFSAHTRRFWLFNFELIYERLLFTLRDLFLKKKKCVKVFWSKKKSAILKITFTYSRQYLLYTIVLWKACNFSSA